jgi:transposase
MSELSKEARINLAITVIRSTDNLSCRKAARMYNVSKDTLTARMAGRLLPNVTELRNRKLTILEEDVVVQYVLELDSRGYPPCFSAVEDMANHILCTKGLLSVGKNWVYRFIQR